MITVTKCVYISTIKYCCGVWWTTERNIIVRATNSIIRTYLSVNVTVKYNIEM